MQLNRLFEIVYILMNKKIITAKELAERFEVSQRTIYRDIETLCQAGIPIYTNKGKGGGICLMENFVLNKSLLSATEQNEILSALQGLKAVSSTETDQVLSKLNTIFGNKNTDWIEVEFSAWSSTEEDRLIFKDLKEAILNRKVVEFDYFNSYSQESHRRSEPVKLVFKGQAWYLYAYCREKEDLRYFKISRLKNLVITSEVFSTAHPLKSNKEVAPTGYEVKTIPIVLKADAEMAYRIFDEFPSEGITRQKDGSFLIKATVTEGSWLIGYLMSFENYLEVLEPLPLREEIKDKFKKSLNNYQ